MVTVFISHPFTADPEGNVARVRLIAREIALQGDIPLAPHLFLPAIVDEPTERRLAIALCRDLVALADEVRVFGEPTEGMLIEIAEAERLGIPVVRGELP